MKLIPGIFIMTFLFSTSLYGQSGKKLIRQGNKHYEENKYKESEIDYRKSLEKDPASVPGRFNLGDAMYKQKNYQEAILAFDTLRNSKAGKDVLSKAYYNLGNSLLNFAQDSAGQKTQALPASIEAYKNSLRYAPADMDTKYNLAYAYKLLQKQQQQQDQQKDKQKDQQKDQKNDQQQQQDRQQDQQKDQQQAQQQQQQQQQPKQLSKEEAERMLQAMQNDEKNTIEKLREKKVKAVRVTVEKDW